MIGIKIIHAVAGCFYVYYLMMLVRCLLTFLPVDWNNSILKVLVLAVDPFLNLFRKFIPPLGAFDFSPIVAFIVLEIVKYIVLYMLAFLFDLLGLLA